MHKHIHTDAGIYVHFGNGGSCSFRVSIDPPHSRTTISTASNGASTSYSPIGWGPGEIWATLDSVCGHVGLQPQLWMFEAVLLHSGVSGYEF